MQNSVRCRSNGDGAVEMQWTVQWKMLCCDGATAMLCSKETVQGRQGSAASSTGSIDGSAVKMLAVRWVYGGCARWQYKRVCSGCALWLGSMAGLWILAGSDIKVTSVSCLAAANNFKDCCQTTSRPRSASSNSNSPSIFVRSLQIPLPTTQIYTKRNTIIKKKKNK
ncbi:hypothetical protein ACFX1X_031520 [Malus domestica]